MSNPMQGEILTSIREMLKGAVSYEQSDLIGAIQAYALFEISDKLERIVDYLEAPEEDGEHPTPKEGESPFMGGGQG